MADDRRTQLFQTLTSLGVKPNVALGAMASLAGESSVNFDPASLGDASIPGGSVGIGQWNKERRTALLNYAQSQKASPNDFGTQLGYLKQELSDPNSATYQSGVLNALRNANSTAQGTQIWTSQFERPKVDNSAQRMQLTSQVGSVDANGNFTPGGGRAPARPVTPTPGTTLNTSGAPTAAPGAPPAVSATGQPPAASGGLAGALPGFQPNSPGAKMTAAGLEKLGGGGGQTDEPPPLRLQQAQPAQAMGGPMMIGPGGQNTFGARAAMQNLAQQGYMTQPTLAAFGPAPTRPAVPAAPIGSATGIPGLPGTTLNSPSQLQMALMTGALSPYDLYANAGGGGGFGSM